MDVLRRSRQVFIALLLPRERRNVTTSRVADVYSELCEDISLFQYDRCLHWLFSAACMLCVNRSKFTRGPHHSSAIDLRVMSGHLGVR